MAKKPPASHNKRLRRWRIIVARAKGAAIGTVEADTAEAAIKIAAEQFGYEEWRLIAQPME